MAEPIPYELPALLAFVRGMVDQRPIRYAIEELRAYVGSKMGSFKSWGGGRNAGERYVPAVVASGWARQFIRDKLDESPSPGDREILGIKR